MLSTCLDRRTFLASAGAVMISAGRIGPASAQGQIEHVHFLSPFPAGFSFDKTCRAAAAAINATHLAKSATSENLPGEGGAKAFTYLLDKSKDHNDTLMLVGTSIIARRGKGQFPYDLSEILPVVRFSAEALVFAVKSDSRFQSIKDVVEAEKSSPGSVRFCSDSDPGLSEQICAAKMLAKAGISPKSMIYVQKSDHGAHIKAVLTGEADVVIAASADVLDQHKDKSLRVIAASSDKRVAQLPDVPTLTEAGIADAVFYNARGFFMAPGTSAERIQAMGDLLEKMIATSEWETERVKADVTMLFARLPEAKAFFDSAQRDVRELQTALGFIKK